MSRAGEENWFTVIFSSEGIAESHSELVGHHAWKTLAELWPRVWTTSAASIRQCSCDLVTKKKRMLGHFTVQFLSNVHFKTSVSRYSSRTAVDFSSSPAVLHFSMSLGDLLSCCLHLTCGGRSCSWVLYRSVYLTSQSTQDIYRNNISAVGSIDDAVVFIDGHPLFLVLVKIVFW